MSLISVIHKVPLKTSVKQKELAVIVNHLHPGSCLHICMFAHAPLMDNDPCEKIMNHKYVFFMLIFNLEAASV